MSPSIWTQRYNENLSNLLMLGGIVNYWTLFFSSWIYGLHLGQKYQWKKHGLWLTVQTWNLVSKRFFNFHIRLSELGGERFSSFKLPLPSLPPHTILIRKLWLASKHYIIKLFWCYFGQPIDKQLISLCCVPGVW